jgi:hypothetical protein
VLKVNPLKMSEFLKNMYFLMKNLPAIYKFLKKTSFSKENVLVLPEFFKNMKDKSPSFAQILEKLVKLVCILVRQLCINLSILNQFQTAYILEWVENGLFSKSHLYL